MGGRLMRMGGGNYERSIAVASNVKLNLCVQEGMLRVNGWNRNEIRVFVKNGVGFNFNVKESAPKENLPQWIDAVAYDPKRPNRMAPDCLWGESIEIDAPIKTVIEVTGHDYRAALDSIKRASITTVGGSITARNIANGLMANTGQGNITVEESAGAMDLATSGGNIIALDLNPSEVGDPFTARSTNGNISLEGVGHGKITVNTISGSVNFTGAIRKSGWYSIATQAGSIRLMLPDDTSCMLGAVYGFGTLTMDFPGAKLLTEEYSEGPVKKRTFKLGGSTVGATMKLQTATGSIWVKKQPAATAP